MLVLFRGSGVSELFYYMCLVLPHMQYLFVLH